MNVLVTGANGFIGAAVVRALLDRGYAVRALVRAGSDVRNLDGLPVELKVGDVRDEREMRQAVRGCELVFHVAALYSFWVRPRSLIYETNVDGTRNVLSGCAAEGVERVVYTSSVAALGVRPDGLPADEKTPVDPKTIAGDYRKSKYLGQQVALAFAEKGLPVVIVNPAFPVGPGDRKPTPTGQTIVDFLNRKMPAYVNTGMSVVDVDDVGLGHVLAAEHGRPGECYILGGENLTLREVFRLISEITGLPAPRVRLPWAPLLPLSYLNVAWCQLTGRVPRMTPETIREASHLAFYSSGKAMGELGYSPRPAREALARAVDWFKRNGYVS